MQTDPTLDSFCISDEDGYLYPFGVMIGGDTFKATCSHRYGSKRARGDTKGTEPCNIQAVATNPARLVIGAVDVVKEWRARNMKGREHG